MHTTFKLAPQATIDSFEEGSLITVSGSDEVVCLGKFEAELLRALVEYGMKATVEKLQEQYDAASIENDVKEFSQALLSQGVLVEDSE